MGKMERMGKMDGTGVMVWMVVPGRWVRLDPLVPLDPRGRKDLMVIVEPQVSKA
jgi:hypothetical protein